MHGDPERAVTHLDKAVRLRSNDYRGHAYNRMYLAVGYLRYGDVRRGVATGTHAVEAVRNLKARQASDHLRALQAAAAARTDSDSWQLADVIARELARR